MEKLSKKHKLIKSLTRILKKNSGRDNTGHISVRHQGGRQKRYYRIIDFSRVKRDVFGEVMRIEYDPNRSAHIALVRYTDGDLSYILHPNQLKVGAKVIASENAEIGIGNALPLKKIPVGTEIHNVEINPGQGGAVVRGAGTSAVVVAHDGQYVQIKLPSGEVKRFLPDCWATVGRVGNVDKKYEIIGKAGNKRHMGIRPTVRGTAQNPRSHPHGGGEGRSGEGMHPKTPWGKPARGDRTRNKDKWTTRLIIKSRKKN